MQNANWLRLADCGEASKLDLSPRPLTLAARDGKTVAYYRGSYCSCAIVVDEPVSFDVATVSVDEFEPLIKLFGQGDVIDKPTKSGITLTQGKRRVTLRTLGEAEDLEHFDTDWTFPVTVEVERDKFVREANIAAAAAAVSLGNPVLTGVHIIAKGSVLGLQAANGTSMLETSLPATVGEPLDIIVPSADFGLALRLIKGDTLGIGVTEGGRSVYLRGKDATIRFPLIIAQWPDMSAARRADYTGSLTLASENVRTVCAAVRAYKTSSTVTLRPSEGGFLVETKESEQGQYQEALEGVLEKAYAFDVADLEFALRAAEDNVTLAFSPSMARMVSGGRRLYMLTRVA